MGTIDKRLEKLEEYITPTARRLELVNDRGEVFYRQVYNPAAGAWVTELERRDLQTGSETVYCDGIAVKSYEGVSLLDL